MAFDPVPGQFYRLVPKHTGKAIGSKDKLPHMGTPMTQVKPADNDATQEFLIHRYGDHYNFIVRQNNQTQCLDVFRDSLADDAAVGQWDRGGGQWNQQFAILPAGDGTYYISPRHSQIFLCVKDGDTKDGAALVQHLWTGGDHFRFSFEPAKPVRSRAQREFALRGADPLREAALGLIGLLPEIGGGVKFVVSHLWSDGPGLIDQMRDYVVGIAQGLIDTDFINGLGYDLEGLRNKVVEYANATKGADKGPWMTDVIGGLEQLQPKFFDNRSPERTLTYLLTFGTLHLLMLRERYDKFEEIYGKKPDNPADLIDRLKKKVDLYVARAKAARDATLNWRMGHIYSWSEQVHTTSRTTYEVFYARDDYDGWRFAADSRSQNVDQRRALRDAAHADHTRIAREQFNAELDGLFNGAAGWKYLNPGETAAPKRTPVVVAGPLFGSAAGTKFDTGIGSSLSSPIAEATIYMNDSSDRVVGLRVSKKDGGQIKVGRETAKAFTKSWSGGEEVIGAYGNTVGSLSALYLVSNRSHIVGSGQRAHGSAFSSEPPIEGGCLDSIFGYASDDKIEGIAFRWAYPRHE